MSASDWQRMNEAFHAAIALPAVDRPEFLARECGHDPELRARLERLIAAHERSPAFLETPAIASADVTFEREIDLAVGRRFGAYRVVREIGRGGMGAVHLAERADGEFRQRVAIKVMKRGMDSASLRRRFRAERQILASLDHPHIARLFDGGTTDDGSPYFIMEFIEGTPVDEYADTHRLSIADRLRLFRQVCAAVSYAHAHHVIHRDIKPANILVTQDGTPKLLDFGIAKALDAEGSGPRVSITGFPLFTPEYASPEQAAGKPITETTDVYSLGVVLYELLTGLSPYVLTSGEPLDVADAIRTSDPERPSSAVTRPKGSDGELRRRGISGDRAAATRLDNTDQLRRQLRGDVDTIVLMALRKEPERRYGSVDALAQDIQRHLDGRPVAARPDSVRYRAAKFVRRSRTALVAAGVAALAVLAVGGALLAFRDSRAGREPSLIALGAIAPRDRILIADLTDRTGDPQLAAALSEAFRVDVAQSPLVQVLSTRQMRAALQRMEQSADIALDDSLARELAMREGVKAFVTGSVSKVARQYTVSAQLVSAEKGDLLAAARETVSDSNAVIGAVDAVSDRLRNRIGESMRSIREMPPLAQVTTASLPALRNYTAGVRASQVGDRSRAIAFLESAVKADTGFASAYRLLGVTYGDVVETGRMITALEHAFANQTRLPFYERYHLLASHAANVLKDNDAAADAYRRVLSRYPNDVRALNNLALVYTDQHRYRAAESLFVRAAAIDSTIPVIFGGLGTAQILGGDFAGAQKTIDLLERRFPGIEIIWLLKIYLAAARQDWAAAELHSHERLARDAHDPADSLEGLETLGGILMTEGRLADAERTFRRERLLAPRLESPGRYLAAALRLGQIELSYHRRSRAAVAIVDSALRRFPLDSIPVGDRPYQELARFFATAGQPTRARELVTAGERTEPRRSGRIDPDRRWSLGVIAFAEGRVQDAIGGLRTASDSMVCAICALPDLARAYEAAGQVDSAIATYARYRSTSWKWRFEPDATELAWATKRLAELYAARGQSARSATTNAQLAQLWHAADPELQPIVAAARASAATATAR